MESLLKQTFKEFELIIIDGNSTDRTELIIAKYSTLLDLKWFSETDNGIYDAMNKGVLKAKGKWIYFIGSDDYLVNSRVLADASVYLEKYHIYDMIYGNVKWGDTGELYNGRYNLEKLLHRNICHQSIFVKRDVLLEEGLYDVKYPVYADWKMNVSIFKHGRKVKYIPLTIAYFNLGGASSSNTSDIYGIELEAEREEFYSNYFMKIKMFLRKVIHKVEVTFR